MMSNSKRIALGNIVQTEFHDDFRIRKDLIQFLHSQRIAIENSASEQEVLQAIAGRQRELDNLVERCSAGSQLRPGLVKQRDDFLNSIKRIASSK